MMPPKTTKSSWARSAQAAFSAAMLAHITACSAGTTAAQGELCLPATVAEYFTAKTTADAMGTVARTVGGQLTQACRQIAGTEEGAQSQFVPADPIEGLVYACNGARKRLEQMAAAGTSARVTPSKCVASGGDETCLAGCQPGSAERCLVLCTAQQHFQSVCDASVVTLGGAEPAAGAQIGNLGIVANSYYRAEFVLESASHLNDVLLELDGETTGCTEETDWRFRVSEDTSLLHSALIVSAQLLEAVTP